MFANFSVRKLEDSVYFLYYCIVTCEEKTWRTLAVVAVGVEDGTKQVLEWKITCWPCLMPPILKIPSMIVRILSHSSSSFFPE